MKNTRYSRFALTLFAGLLIAAGASQVLAQQPNKKAADAAQTKPETLGFSSERLERLHAAMQQEVDQKRLAGITTILARHGKVVEERTYGKKDIASGAPMTKDTIFRIYSMSKPVTGAAMMILYEEGKWHPSDPISKYIPEFARLKDKIDGSTELFHGPQRFAAYRAYCHTSSKRTVTPNYLRECGSSTSFRCAATRFFYRRRPLVRCWDGAFGCILWRDHFKRGTRRSI